jgi:hypothetical protein
MAINENYYKFDRQGFGQFEPNQVWFTRNGAIEAQCKLDPKVFTSDIKTMGCACNASDGKIYGEVGQFLAVDKAPLTGLGNGNGIATVPTATTDEKGLPVGVNYSTEKIYNQFTPGRRNYYMTANDFNPRIGFLSVGERFTTNTVLINEQATSFKAVKTADVDGDVVAASRATWANIRDALKEGNVIYAILTTDSEGQLVVGATVDANTQAIGGIYTRVVKAYTNADGTLSFMFQVINKPVTTNA